MQELIRNALALHQRGNLREAELGYRKCLQENPDHPDALHLLGVIAHQSGNHTKAGKLIEHAIRVNANVAAYHFNLAEVYRTLGRAGDAAQSYQRAIDIKPDYAAAHNNLGLLLLATGEASQAEASFRQALALQADFALAWTNLGLALRAQRQFSEAVEACRTALKYAPNLAEVHNNLGRVLLECGQLNAALHHCQESIRLRPTVAAAHSNLGNAYRALGNYQAARASHEEALRLSPETAMIHHNMAQLLQEEGHREAAFQRYYEALQLAEHTPLFHCSLASLLVQDGDLGAAIEHCQRALEINPHDADAHDGMGQAYREAGRVTDAVAEFQTAIQLSPNFALAHIHLGETFSELGDLTSAHNCYREAIAIDPKAIGAWVNLATHHSETLSDEDFGCIESLLSDPHLKDGPRSAVHFALAHVLDAQQEYNHAARHSRDANRYQLQSNARRQRGYSTEQHSAFVDQLIDCFDAEYFQRVCQPDNSWGSDAETPVFIVGMPRSGTTLTEQILASHSGVLGAGELKMIKPSLQRVLAAAKADETFKKRLAGLTAAVVHRSAAEYLEQLTALNPDANRIVEKMPENYLYLGWIVTMFPRARIIHCRRDPYSIALSCWMTGFKGVRWANDPQHIANRIANYQRLMSHWAQTLPREILHIDYADTVSDLAAVAHRLVDHLGLPWDQKCLDFHQTDRPVSTASASQVRRPVYERSLERWKDYLLDLPELFAAIKR